MDSTDNTTNGDSTQEETAEAKAEAGDSGDAPENFAEMLAAETMAFKEGEVVPGTIIDVGEDYIVIDIGFKSEGVVSVSEFRRSGQMAVVIGVSRSFRFFLSSLDGIVQALPNRLNGHGMSCEGGGTGGRKGLRQ